MGPSLHEVDRGRERFGGQHLMILSGFGRDLGGERKSEVGTECANCLNSYLGISWPSDR